MEAIVYINLKFHLPVGSLSLAMLAGERWVSWAHDYHGWMTSGLKYNLRSLTYPANLQVEYVQLNVKSKT